MQNESYLPISAEHHSDARFLIKQHRCGQVNAFVGVLGDEKG